MVAPFSLRIRSTADVSRIIGTLYEMDFVDDSPELQNDINFDDSHMIKPDKGTYDDAPSDCIDFTLDEDFKDVEIEDECWDSVCTGEEVDLEVLESMDEVTPNSYPYRLKRDVNKTKEDWIRIRRKMSKTEERNWRFVSEESLQRRIKKKRLLIKGTKKSKESVEKMKKTLALKKKYTTKVVPRKKTYSGVVYK